MPAGRVLGVMVATLVVALGLSAGAIERKAAGRRPNSEVRRELAADVGRLSAALGLDRPEQAVDDALGPLVGHERATSDEDSSDLAARARAANGATPLTSPPVSTPGSTRPGATAPPTTLPNTTPRLRAPTPQQPLRLWVGGDSISIEVGASLARLSAETKLFEVVRDSRPSTGLTRPDFFNWPDHLLRDVTPLDGGGVDPDILVIMFGGNDDQNIPAWKGQPIASSGSAAWLAEYRRRVADTMDLLKSADNDRLIVWPGMPATRPGTIAHGPQMNQIFASEAARRPWVRYVDSWAYFTDATGRYASALPAANGRTQELRTGDGIHLNSVGGLRLAYAVWAAIGERVALDAAPLTVDPAAVAPPTVEERQVVPAS